MRAIRGWTEIDRLEFAVNWESIRAAYFEGYGKIELSKSLTKKALKLKREYDFLQNGRASIHNDE
tara:strand:- start:4 stop:198 length:195 start_codon:yes stop_codon:yes gene_type:complete